MKKMQRVFLFLIMLISNHFAQEDLFSYKINLDTTIVGAVSAEGNIFPNYETTFISLYNTFKTESLPPSIVFHDENFNEIYKITFNTHKSSPFINPLVFDFDGDSFDEVVFAIEDKHRIWYLYFDPSNKALIQSEIFEIPLKKKGIHYSTSMAVAQLDEDKFFELVVTINEKPQRKFPINGMWAIDIEEKIPLWENLTAENFVKNSAINIVNDSLSYLISSSSSSSGKDRFGFSNGNFFVINKNGEKTFYNKDYQIINNAIIDTLSNDYSIDSVSSIQAIDAENNLLWRRKVGGLSITTKIDTIKINNKNKILLAVSSSRASNKKESILEIINPLTGTVEKRNIFKEQFKNIFSHNNIIYVSLNTNEIIQLDYGLNILNSTKSKLGYSPIAEIKTEDCNLLLAREGIGSIQSIEIFDDELNKVAKRLIDGIIIYLPDSKLISVYNTGTRLSKLYSIHSIPWYNTISLTTLRNLVISFLLIIVVTMLLWINTLRVSSKKIKHQKNELEATNQELRSTTSRLVQVEKLAVYGTIASSIAHEINSPLGAIINSAQRIKENNTIDFEKNINLIEKAGKRSKAIIEKLLLGARKNDEEVSANLKDVLAEWNELSYKQFENLGIKLQVELNCNCLLAISPIELNQIFTNILFNARDSIVEKNSNDKKIIIKSTTQGNNCSIIIQDTGTGFSKSKLQNPFEAFDTTKEKGRGTGLGLWVVNNIISNINGELSIKNYDLGAEIKISIPLYIERKNGTPK